MVPSQFLWYSAGSWPDATAGGGRGPAVSVVVPCYNEEEVVGELHDRLTRVCRELGLPYEIIVVNDGSRDRTWPLLNELAARDDHLILVNLSRNHGHQLALTAGLCSARGGRTLILDADLQDPPELLPEMMKAMDSGADVVYGVRRRREGESRLKLATAALFYRLIERLTDVPIPRDAGDFRLISRRALDVLLAMPERHRFVRGMVSWIGFRHVPLLYDRQPRFAGETKYPLGKMIRFALDAVTAFSTKPLALASWAGIAMGLFSCALLAYSMVSWLRGEAVVGWTSLMATMTLMGSVQLVVLGVLGEYVGRMYEQVKGRPLFIVERVIRSAASPDHDGDTVAACNDDHARTHRPASVPPSEAH
jgi:polyisoprenyl-phosphate glycosyltransferase